MGDFPAHDLTKGAALNEYGMVRCTIWRHGGLALHTPVAHRRAIVYPPGSKCPNDAAINVGFFRVVHAAQIPLNDYV